MVSIDANRLIESSEDFEPDQKTPAIDRNAWYLRLLVGVLGTLLGAYLMIIIDPYDIHPDLLLLVFCGFLVMLLAIGLLSLLCLYFFARRNEVSMTKYMGALLVYVVISLLYYVPIHLVLAVSVDVRGISMWAGWPLSSGTKSNNVREEAGSRPHPRGFRLGVYPRCRVVESKDDFEPESEPPVIDNIAWYLRILVGFISILLGAYLVAVGADEDDLTFFSSGLFIMVLAICLGFVMPCCGTTKSNLRQEAGSRHYPRERVKFLPRGSVKSLDGQMSTRTILEEVGSQHRHPRGQRVKAPDRSRDEDREKSIRAILEEAGVRTRDKLSDDDYEKLIQALIEEAGSRRHPREVSVRPRDRLRDDDCAIILMDM